MGPTKRREDLCGKDGGKVREEKKDVNRDQIIAVPPFESVKSTFTDQSRSRNVVSSGWLVFFFFFYNRNRGPFPGRKKKGQPGVSLGITWLLTLTALCCCLLASTALNRKLNV